MIVRHEAASETAIRECRLYFLRAAAEHPNIRLGESLRAKVFEPSGEMWAKLGLPVPNVPSCQWRPGQDGALPEFYREQARLIGEWATGHNLNYDWVHQAAGDALGWPTFPAQPFNLRPGYEPPEFIWVGWYEGEAEKEYRKRVMASFRKQLGAYIRGAKLAHKEVLNHRDPFSQECLYAWAAEHVCLSRQFSEITENVRPARTEQAVRQGVLKVLERIGIPPNYNLRKAKNRTS